MRTNVVLDDDLMDRAMRLSERKTKKGVIEEALHLLIRIKRQKAIRKLRGRLRWDGDLDAMRRDR